MEQERRSGGKPWRPQGSYTLRDSLCRRMLQASASETQQAAASPASTALKGSDSARGSAERHVTRAAQMHSLLLKRQQPVPLAAGKQATDASAILKSVDKDAKSKGPDGCIEGSRCICRVCQQ